MSLASPEQLHLLIRSLTKSEKIYFRTFAAPAKDGQQQYLKLYNVLLKQEQYDSTAVRQALGPLSAQAMSNLRRHLFDQLMLALEICHRNDPVVRLQRNLIASEILRRRGIMGPAIELMNHDISYAVAVADHQHLLPQLLQQLNNRRTNFMQDIAGMDALLRNIRQRLQEVSEQLYSEGAFMHAFARSIRQKKAGRATSGKKTRSAVPRLKLAGGSFKKLLNDATRLSAGYYYAGQQEQSRLIDGQLVAIFAANPALARHYPADFLNVHYNYYLSLFFAKAYEQCREIITLLNNWLKGDLIGKPVYTCRILLLETTFYYKTGDVPGSLKAADRTNLFLKKHDKLPYYHQICDLHISCLCIYLSAGKLRQASASINRFFEIDKIQEQSAVKNSLVKILQLIICFEKNDMELLLTCCTNFYRQLRRKKQLFQYEKLFISTMRKVANSGLPAVQQKELVRLRQQLLQVPDRAVFEQAFDFPGWFAKYSG